VARSSEAVTGKLKNKIEKNKLFHALKAFLEVKVFWL